MAGDPCMATAEAAPGGAHRQPTSTGKRYDHDHAFVPQPSNLLQVQELLVIVVAAALAIAAAAASAAARAASGAAAAASVAAAGGRAHPAGLLLSGLRQAKCCGRARGGNCTERRGSALGAPPAGARRRAGSLGVDRHDQALRLDGVAIMSMRRRRQGRSRASKGQLPGLGGPALAHLGPAAWPALGLGAAQAAANLQEAARLHSRSAAAVGRVLLPIVGARCSAGQSRTMRRDPRSLPASPLRAMHVEVAGCSAAAIARTFTPGALPGIA